MNPVQRLQVNRTSHTSQHTPTVWGLDAQELHDAYWRAKGIQCVRRTEHFDPQSGRDLFMLLDPGQCTVFDLGSLANAIAWNRAPLSRIRVAATTQPYVERIIENGRGELVKIAREYGGTDSGSCRVLLTRRAALAQIWANSEKRRSAWTELRRFIDWTRTDHYRIEGFLSRCNTPESAQLLIELLVQEWPEPGLALEGLTEIRPGIWGLAGTRIQGLDHIVAPVWIGHRSDQSLSGILVGPAALGDEDSGETQNTNSPRVLDIAEIRQASNRDRILPEEDVSLYQLSKRWIDFAVALIFLILLSPLMIGVAVSIIIQDGRPAFFPHIRQTRGGRDFKCWKFRTMLRDAESMVSDLSHENLADGPQVYIRNDPRITRFGRFLRRYHLDELPQFWNVLVGEMSLVGPRPSPDRENQFCPAWREARLSVRPGVTGLWQVERTRAPGRDFQEWIKYDIEYVNRASFMLDIRIFIKTVVRIIRGQG